MKKLYLYSLILMLLVPAGASAWHIVGGELYYECIGNDDYIITLKVYRDCNSQGAPFDNPATVAIYDTSGIFVTQVQMPNPSITLVPPYINNPCLTSPPNVCVEEGIYAEVVNLPPIPGGYTLVYQRCCRNASINNIFQPEEQGATYTTHIPGPPYHCNNSAYFSNFPPIVLCTNDTLVFDHSATDLDGDSLFYRFATPYSGGSQANPLPLPFQPPPFPNVLWNPGYSITYPIDANPAFNLDPNSGLLVGSPTMLGQYVVTVVAKEYRNGTLLTENRRDFQFNTAICLSATQAGIAPQSQFCTGTTFSFQNQSLFTTYYQWDFGDPNTNADTSSFANPTWTYSDTGTYTVTLIANPGFQCADTITTQVQISDGIPVDFSISGDDCIDGNFMDFTVLSQHTPDAQYDWDFGDGTASQQMNPTKVYTDDGIYPVTLTVSENSCATSFTDTVRIFPEVEPSFDTDTLTGCAPFTVEFVDETNTWVNINYLWEFGDGQASTQDSPTHTYSLQGTYDVTLTIEVLEGCVDTHRVAVEQMIVVEPSPTAGFYVDPEVTSFFEPVVSVHDTSTGAYWTTFDMGDSTSYAAPFFDHRYLEDGTYTVRQVVGNEYGCTDTTYRTVVVKPEYLLYVPNVFTPNGDGLNEYFAPKVFGEIEYQFSVYSRWGDRIFYSEVVGEGWNGEDAKKDMPAPQDTYLWEVKVLDIDGAAHREVGYFSLIR